MKLNSDNKGRPMNIFRNQYRLWFIPVLLSLFIAACGGNDRDPLLSGEDSGLVPVQGEDGPAPVSPTVTAVFPGRDATAVALNTSVLTAAFTTDMDPLTLTGSSFTLNCPTGTAFTGTVSYINEGRVASLSLSGGGSLPAETTCTAVIANTVADVAGNNMLADYSWNFTTGLLADTTRPQVVSTVPEDEATDVALDSLVSARFSEAMDPLTVTATGVFSLECPLASDIAGTVAYAVNSHVATFSPDEVLPPFTLCQASIATDAEDTAGNALLEPYIWEFTTGANADTTPPTVTLVFPEDFATDVPLDTAVNATFSEDMDPLSITSSSFILEEMVPVSGLVSYDLPSRIATFQADDPLEPDTTYTATVTTSAEDLAGNALVMDEIWTFTTGDGLAPGAVALGNARTFGIMATSAITSTGATMINGDVSLDPGTSQGIPPAQVNGTIHVNNDESAAARIDLLEAYNFAKTLPPGITIAAGADLGALYPDGIPPGTYTSGSTMLVSTTLTLDAGGDANAVWVFQIGSSLTTSANVLMSPGAQAKNIFWVPTEDATIGVGTTFSGTIVAGRDTTAQTGAVINGRILSGAITAGTIALDNNTVNVPAP